MAVQERYDGMIQEIEREAGRGDLTASALAEKIARENGLGIRDLTTVMRYLTGRTLLDYIRDRKLMAACRYLTQEAGATILQAVSISGYDNQSSFTKRFTAVFGVPPREAMRHPPELVPPLTWDTLGAGGEPAVAISEASGRSEDTVFGLPREAFETVMRASELERMYGLHPAFSQMAFRMWEEPDREESGEEPRSMEDCFRFLSSVQDVYTVRGQFSGEDDPEELARNAKAEYVDSPFYRFMFFACGISVETASALMIERIMPSEEELMEMDPDMIRAFSLSDEDFKFNFFFFRKAYQYFMRHGAGYGDYEFSQFLEMLDQNIPIEIAFENIMPDCDDSEFVDVDLTPDDWIEDPWAPVVEEEERWRNVLLDPDLDEENFQYEVEDLLDPGLLDF